MNAKQTDSLFTSVVQLTDPRQLQGQRHTRRALTAIMFCATLCGARGYEAISDWAQQLSQPMRKRLGCTKRGGRYLVPSRSTLYRFINAVDPCEVDTLLGRWLDTFGGEDPGIAMIIGSGLSIDLSKPESAFLAALKRLSLERKPTKGFLQIYSSLAKFPGSPNPNTTIAKCPQYSEPLVVCRPVAGR